MPDAKESGASVCDEARISSHSGDSFDSRSSGDTRRTRWPTHVAWPRTPDLDARSSTRFRDFGLTAIALLQRDAGDQGGLARALRRIALLSEEWECLDCEPDRAEAATEMTDFCLTAIEHLVCEQRTGGGDLGIGNEILRQSNTRWSDLTLSPRSIPMSVQVSLSRMSRYRSRTISHGRARRCSPRAGSRDPAASPAGVRG